MTRDDLRILSTALGFMAVILKDVPNNKQTPRAVSIARLIESFCMVAAPDTTDRTPTGHDDGYTLEAIDTLIEKYKDELPDTGFAPLPYERRILLKFYDRLLHRKAQIAQTDFYVLGSDAELATQVWQLMDQEYQWGF